VDETQDTFDNLSSLRKAILVVAVGALLYGGYCLWQSPKVRIEAASVPRMTCAELVKNGPGQHRHVVLTDAWFNLGGRSVSERDSDTGALEMYHPLYPAKLKEQPAPADLTLILCIMDEMKRRRIRDLHNQQQQLGRTGLGNLTGAVTSSASLPDWARAGLAKEYAGIPLNQCWIITIGKYEPTELRADNLMSHGIIATSAGCAAILGWWVWRRIAGRGSHASRGAFQAGAESIR
jgi:hypothetical protein